jgi:hypothetical protein
MSLFSIFVPAPWVAVDDDEEIRAGVLKILENEVEEEPIL